MSALVKAVVELLRLIPATQRWIVVVALVAGFTYYETHRQAQSDSNALIDTYTGIVQFEAAQAASCTNNGGVK